MLVPFTYRGWWITFHGVVLGGLFIVSLALVLMSLPQLRQEVLTPEGATVRLLWLRRGLLLMTVVAWSAVVVGTFVVDPWFHQHVAGSPLTLLEARPSLTFWTDIVLEWKERISWTAAIVASGGAYLATYYGDDLVWDRRARLLIVAVFAVAFAAALAAGAMGLLLTKIAPVT